MQWASHEPPLLAEQFAPDQWRDVARVDPLLHAQTEAAGLVFQHFAYATQQQLEFKERYYGYNRAVLRSRPSGGAPSPRAAGSLLSLGQGRDDGHAGR